MTDWHPYADGTSGHQGDASQASEPIRRQRIPSTYRMIRERGRYGLTVKELREQTGWHHGMASSALSNLHRDGHVVKLRARREKCGIYVLPEHATGRETVPFRRNRRA